MKEIIELVQNGDIEKVKEFLQNDASSVNIAKEGMTPLLWACQLRSSKMTRLLLDFGANANMFGSDGETPLHIAAFEDIPECVQQLISHGADVNVRTDDGKTPLMNAAQVGSLVILEELLRAGADPDIPDNMGRTPLHWAVVGQHDNPSIARTLITAGIKIDRKSTLGDTAIDYARRLNRLNSLKMLSSVRV